MPPAVADIAALLRVLAEHGVEFVVVGGVCAVIQGAPVATFALDVVPDRSADNVTRLLRALLSIEACHRDQGGQSIAPDAVSLSGPGHNLFMTRVGPVDLLGTVGRGRDYAALEPRSRAVDVGDGSMVRVLDLDALIDVTRETGRDTDLATLPVLTRTLEERRRGGDR